MSNIETIEDGESLLTVRQKLNAAIAEANKLKELFVALGGYDVEQLSAMLNNVFDTVPLPNFLTAALSQNEARADLSWTDTNNNDKFLIYQNGTQVLETTGLSASIVLADNENSFHLVPVKNGEVGSQSNTVNLIGGSVSYNIPTINSESRTFHPVLRREQRHYTIPTTVVSGYFNFQFQGYLSTNGSNASPACTIISGYVDLNNYFAIGIDDAGNIYHEQCVAGELTRSTDSDSFSVNKISCFSVSRIGSDLSIETQNSLRRFSVPSSDFVIDTICGRRIDGGFSDGMVGSVRSILFESESEILIDSDFSDDLSVSTVVSNNGTIGGINAVNIPSTEVLDFSILAGDLEWTSTHNYFEDNYSLILENASDGEIIGGSANYSNRIVDGVFSQRFSASSNTTSGGIKIVYGYNGPSLLPGEIGPVTWPGSNTGRVYFTSKADGNNGTVSDLTANPIMDQTDPRETYTIVHLGDSITNYMIHQNQGSYIDLAQSYNGIKLHVINEGVGGHTIVQMRDRLPTILADQAGKKRVLIVIMAGSNWVDGHTVDDYDAVLREMVASVYAAGFECAVMNKTANVNNDTMADEPGVNTESNNVVCRELTPTWYDFDSGRPRLDGFSILLGGQNESPSLFRDNLHPSEEGEQVLINSIAPIIADRVWRLFDV